MDAVAMALHCAWTTETFTAAVLKVARLGLDICMHLHVRRVRTLVAVPVQVGSSH